MTGQAEQHRQDTSDEVLARRTRDGDRAAFEQLIRRYLRPVRAVVSSFLREEVEVEDAVQDTFLRFLDTIEKFDPTRPLAPWLYQIARNIARNRTTTLLRQAPVPLPGLESGMELESGEAGPEAATTDQALREFLKTAIAALPEQRRTAFHLADVEGYSTEETARIMGLTPGTVRSHIHHARRVLRSALQARGFETPQQKSEVKA